MGIPRSGYFMWRAQVALVAVVFPIALIIYAFSGCDLRRRSEKRGCRNGSADQCLAVGKFYEARTDGLIATMLSNATTAKKYYDRACKLGNRTGCARFGHMVVVGMYDVITDDVFTRNNGIAALQKACDGGDVDACRELADAVDSAAAVPVLEKLCAGGDKDGCDKLKSAYLDTDPKRAIELLDKLCNAGDDDHCQELGRAFLAGSKYVDADPARGVALLTKACDHGSWEGCTELGNAYVDGTLPADPARAGALFAKGCEHDDADACFEYGKSLVDTDPAKALQTFTVACDRRDSRGCDALGDLYRVGAAGIPRDVDRMMSFYSRACTNGDMYVCYKRDCYNTDEDACYKMKHAEKDRVYRLGGRFDMR